MSNWMKQLALHYEKTRERHPRDRLIILFDIDGTILDMRSSLLYLLKSYDRVNSTEHFKELCLKDIRNHETELEKMLDPLLPPEQRDPVLAWCRDNFWKTETILESHRPFSGVLEVIRWFQIQPDTYIGLNTGRPESIRKDTLASLNRIGEEYRVHFADDLLYMNTKGWGGSIRQWNYYGRGSGQNRRFYQYEIIRGIRI